MFSIAAILTAVGALGLVISSLVHTSAVSETIFGAAAICLVTGPLLFLSYVIIGLCIEFARLNRRPELVTVSPLPPPPRIPVSNAALDKWIPEGLQRKPKGPLGRTAGRAANFRS
jgi:hypothetical protein